MFPVARADEGEAPKSVWWIGRLMTAKLGTMCKRTAILGLLLLLVGGVLFGWVFTEQKKEDQLEQKRSETLKASLGKIDAAVGDEIDTSHFEKFVVADRQREPSD